MPDGLAGFALRTVVVLALLAGGMALVQRFFFDFMAQRPADYAGTEPVFDLRSVLSGPLLADGVIYGPTGRVASRFVADMQGRWENDAGTLSESFRYDSGRTQQREWRISLGPDGSFTGTADDVVGTAEGQVSGSAAVMRYRLRLPEEAGGWELDVTDWLYLGEDGVIVNRSQFRRFGILLGELVGTIRPVAE